MFIQKDPSYDRNREFVKQKYIWFSYRSYQTLKNVRFPTIVIIKLLVINLEK